MNSAPTPLATLVTTDLMLESQVAGAARNHAVRFLCCGELPQAIQALKAAGGALAVDLNLGGVDLQTVRDEFPTGGNVRLTAFGPHVHRQRLDAAHAAGFDEVLSRGQFLSHIDRWLTTLKSSGQRPDS